MVVSLAGVGVRPGEVPNTMLAGDAFDPAREGAWALVPLAHSPEELEARISDVAADIGAAP